jgi:rhodanese-related sulfurtransferase
LRDRVPRAGGAGSDPFPTYRRLTRDLADVPEIDAPEAARRLASGEAVALDVREPPERAVSTIPGAVASLDPADRSGRIVIVYCTIGVRSGLAARALRAQGVDARNLAAGVLGWANSGLPFVGPDGPTRRVHTWSRRFAILPDGYEPAW